MNELQKMNDADLKTHINEKREALRGLKFSSSGSGMRDTHARRNIRKEIARALTELNRRANQTEVTNA